MKLLNEIFGFLLPQRTGHTFQFAVFLSGVAILFALFGVPMIDRAAEEYAENRSFGIDRVITSSVEKLERTTVRKSVLDD